MEIKAFNGINNTTDPVRLGLGWLATADNVNITDTGAIVKRDGYAAPVAGAYSGIYSTIDFQRCYLVDAGTLKTIGWRVLATGLGTGTVYWTELNDQVYFLTDTASGIILPDDSVIAWGWTTPAAPTVSAVTGSLPAGLYRVICTTTLPDGRETGTGPTVDITLTEGQALQIVATGNVYIAPANSTVFQYAGGGGTFVWNQSPDLLGRDLLSLSGTTITLSSTFVNSYATLFDAIRVGTNKVLALTSGVSLDSGILVDNSGTAYFASESSVTPAGSKMALYVSGTKVAMANSTYFGVVDCAGNAPAYVERGNSFGSILSGLGVASCNAKFQRSPVFIYGTDFAEMISVDAFMGRNYTGTLRVHGLKLSIFYPRIDAPNRGTNPYRGKTDSERWVVDQNRHLTKIECVP